MYLCWLLCQLMLERLTFRNIYYNWSKFLFLPLPDLICLSFQKNHLPCFYMDPVLTCIKFSSVVYFSQQTGALHAFLGVKIIVLGVCTYYLHYRVKKRNRFKKYTSQPAFGCLQAFGKFFIFFLHFFFFFGLWQEKMWTCKKMPSNS